MTKEKMISLVKYVEAKKALLASNTVPEKQKNRVESYKRFLRNEIALHTAKIEAAKLASAPDSKK